MHFISFIHKNKIASRSGHANAMAMLARCYRSGGMINLAIKWSTKAADAGSVLGRFDALIH
jgi:TPR repeat protein